MRHESDYFQPIRDLEREAAEFLKCRNIHTWYNTRRFSSRVVHCKKARIQIKYTPIYKRPRAV